MGLVVVGLLFHLLHHLLLRRLPATSAGLSVARPDEERAKDRDDPDEHENALGPNPHPGILPRFRPGRGPDGYASLILHLLPADGDRQG